MFIFIQKLPPFTIYPKLSGMLKNVENPMMKHQFMFIFIQNSSLSRMTLIYILLNIFVLIAGITFPLITRNCVYQQIYLLTTVVYKVTFCLR